MDQMKTDHLSETGLQIDGEVRQHFADGTKWAKFISILMFVVCGIMLLAGIAGSAAFASVFRNFGGFGTLMRLGSGIIIVSIIIAVAVCGVMFYFLFNFSSKTKESLITGNSATMDAGLSSLKVYFIIAGILGILSLLFSLYSLFQTSKYL